MQAWTSLLRALKEETCLVLNENGHVTLNRVYNHYLMVTQDDGSNDAHHLQTEQGT